MNKKTVIFDLFGVLFFIDSKKILAQLGIWNTILYLLKYQKTPYTATYEILEKMRVDYPGEFQDCIAYKGRYLPQPLCLWQQGELTNQKALAIVKNYVDVLHKQHFFPTEREYRLFCAAIDIMFDRRQLIGRIYLNKKLVKTIQELKRKKYQLIILSNIDHELLSSLQKKYPEVFMLFDGMVASCQTKLIKPYKPIFEHLLQTYGLDPKECFYIDDQQENIDTGKELGIDGLLYKKRISPDLIIQLLEQSR